VAVAVFGAYPPDPVVDLLDLPGLLDLGYEDQVRPLGDYGLQVLERMSPSGWWSPALIISLGWLPGR
jgi:hypothetical protein